MLEKARETKLSSESSIEYLKINVEDETRLIGLNLVSVCSELNTDVTANLMKAYSITKKLRAKEDIGDPEG